VTVAVADSPRLSNVNDDGDTAYVQPLDCVIGKLAPLTVMAPVRCPPLFGATV
jgi:hypothetical protein